MKIFDNEEGTWLDRVNFVDKNNVFVGFSTEQNCCEYADWVILDKDNLTDVYVYQDVDKFVPEDIEDYIFDTSYFKHVEYALDEGGIATFRLVNGEKELFLHLFNYQNGYYGHGFEAKINEEIWQHGTL